MRKTYDNGSNNFDPENIELTEQDIQDYLKYYSELRDYENQYNITMFIINLYLNKYQKQLDKIKLHKNTIDKFYKGMTFVEYINLDPFILKESQLINREYYFNNMTLPEPNRKLLKKDNLYFKKINKIPQSEKFNLDINVGIDVFGTLNHNNNNHNKNSEETRDEETKEETNQEETKEEEETNNNFNEIEEMKKLPYSGNIQEAMKKQDRDAIKRNYER